MFRFRAVFPSKLLRLSATLWPKVLILLFLIGIHMFTVCILLRIASDGCLQYFTGVSGQMFSFNYNDASGLQLSNTDYSICVRMDRNFCGIQYTACPDTGMITTDL